MFAQVVMRNPDSPLEFIWIFIFNLFLLGLMLWLVYCFVGQFLEANKKHKRVLKLLRQSLILGNKKVQWLNDHKSDLEKDLVATLYNPELVRMTQEDQQVYEKICSLDPKYANSGVMSPNALYQSWIDLAVNPSTSKP